MCCVSCFVCDSGVDMRESRSELRRRVNRRRPAVFVCVQWLAVCLSSVHTIQLITNIGLGLCVCVFWMCSGCVPYMLHV